MEDSRDFIALLVAIITAALLLRNNCASHHDARVGCDPAIDDRLFRL
jgi:hypothetical protein